MQRTRKIEQDVQPIREYPVPAAERNKWRDDFIHQVYILSLLGATDKQIADCFGISEVTLHNWERTKDEFFLSKQKGKTIANAEVAESLFKRAVGFERDEEEIHVAYGNVLRVPVKKYYPPDSWAAAKILSLREKGVWSESKDATPPALNIGTLNLNVLSTNELKLLQSIQHKNINTDPQQ